MHLIALARGTTMLAFSLAPFILRIQTGINLEATKHFMFSLFKDVYMSSYTSKYGDTK